MLKKLDVWMTEITSEQRAGTLIPVYRVVLCYSGLRRTRAAGNRIESEYRRSEAMFEKL